jgi:hypothetical protein
LRLLLRWRPERRSTAVVTGPVTSVEAAVDASWSAVSAPLAGVFYNYAEATDEVPDGPPPV